MNQTHKRVPTINTIKGFNNVFNKVDNYRNMIEYPTIKFRNELFELNSVNSWDLSTIYKNKDNSITLEIEPKFINNNRKFKKVSIIDFN